jgi:hypothetical protein
MISAILTNIAAITAITINPTTDQAAVEATPLPTPAVPAVPNAVDNPEMIGPRIDIVAPNVENTVPIVAMTSPSFSNPASVNA